MLSPRAYPFRKMVWFNLTLQSSTCTTGKYPRDLSGRANSEIGYRDNVGAPIQFRKSITPELLDSSNETSWVFPALNSSSHLLARSLVSRWSDSSSEANSNFSLQIRCLITLTVHHSIISIDTNVMDNNQENDHYCLVGKV